MSETNLEFRKIPSLRYLYEISTDGRHVRNVKSKKYCRIFLKKGTYYVRVRDRKYARGYMICSIPQLCEECHIPSRKITKKSSDKMHCADNQFNNRPSEHHQIAVILTTREKQQHIFPNITKAAEYVAQQTQRTHISIRRRMQHRRSHILGYDVSYRDAETVHR